MKKPNPWISVRWFASRWIIVGTAIFVGLGLVGLALGSDPDPVDMVHALEGPSWQHLLGTDNLGRDLLRRTVVATRAFFIPGFFAALIAVGLGVPLGALAGYEPQPMRLDGPWGGWVGTWVRGSVALLLALPAALPRFVSVVLLFATFGFGPAVLAVSLGVLYAADLGEDVRQRVLSCAREEYIMAARAEGLPLARVLGFHILWLHCRGLIARHLVHLWAFVILVETSLSYLPGEFGVQEPDPSWGNMLVSAQDAALVGQIWPSVVITSMIVGTVVFLAIVGDRLGRTNDDPSMNERTAL